MKTEPLKKHPIQSAMFVHSRLDDFGLNPSEFRVYGHLVRRASKTGRAWPSVKNMAKACRLHPRTLRKALKSLASYQMIKPEPQLGETTVYTLLPLPQWRSPVKSDSHPTQTNAYPSKWSTPMVKQSQTHPAPSDTDKGTPLEGTPTKGTPHSPPVGDILNDTGSNHAG